MRIINLCQSCGSCPVVEIGENEVKIGEPGEQAKLSKEAWNNLVNLIERKELGKI